MKSMYVKNVPKKIDININTDNTESNDNGDSNNSNTNHTYSNIILFEKSKFEIVNPIIDNNNTNNDNRKKILTLISKKNMTNEDKQQLDKFILEEAIKQSQDSFRLFTIFNKFTTGAISMSIQPEKKIVCRLKGAREIKEDVLDVSKLKNKKVVKGIAIIIDPRVNTNGEEYILRLTYEILEDRVGVPNIMDKVTKILDVSICGNGKSYNLKFISSFISYQDQAHDSFDVDLDISLPGWNGKAPIYIPAEICKCELVCPVSSLHSFDTSFSSKRIRSVKSAPDRIKSAGKFRSTSPTIKKSNIANVSQMPSLGTRPKSAGLFNSMSTNRLSSFIPKEQLVQISFLAFPATSLKNSLQTTKEFLNHQWHAYSVDCVIPGGLSALSLATMHGNIEFVKTLIINGSNVNAVSSVNKSTALHQSIEADQLEILEVLLESNASQLVVDIGGSSPLHLAAKLGRSNMITKLLRAPNVRKALTLLDCKGRSPLEVASCEYVRNKIYSAMVGLRLITIPKPSAKALI